MSALGDRADSGEPRGAAAAVPGASTIRGAPAEDEAAATPQHLEAPQEGTPAWAEWVKDYYRTIETYDWVEVSDHLRGPEAIFHKNRERVVRRLVARYARPGEPILDAGCGTGLNLRHLPAGSVGLDINPRNIAVVSARVPGCAVVLGDVEAMPFPDASFGTVVCTEVLEHIPEPERALGEIERVLRPDGVLIGSVPAHSLIWRLRFLSTTCPRDEPFHNEYTLEQVREMLGRFEIIEMRYSLLHFNVMFVARGRSYEQA
jgi:ubiquinone/menaquinone biosynthesis C-methylase UbiE